jgi:hypothetical protein
MTSYLPPFKLRARLNFAGLRRPQSQPQQICVLLTTRENRWNSPHDCTDSSCQSRVKVMASTETSTSPAPGGQGGPLPPPPGTGPPQYYEGGPPPPSYLGPSPMPPPSQSPTPGTPMAQSHAQVYGVFTKMKIASYDISKCRTTDRINPIFGCTTQSVCLCKYDKMELPSSEIRSLFQSWEREMRCHHLYTTITISPNVISPTSPITISSSTYFYFSPMYTVINKWCFLPSDSFTYVVLWNTVCLALRQNLLKYLVVSKMALGEISLCDKGTCWNCIWRWNILA